MLLISSDSGIVAVFILESIENLKMSLTVTKVSMNFGVVSVLEFIEISKVSWTMVTVSVLCLNLVH